MPARVGLLHFALDGDRIIRSSISCRAFLWPVSLWRNHGNRNPTTYFDCTRDVESAERKNFFWIWLFRNFMLKSLGCHFMLGKSRFTIRISGWGFLAKKLICPGWCSNTERVVIYRSPFDLREKSRKILRKHPSTECAFQISTLCFTYDAHTLRISLVPYTHSNLCCMRCISYVLLRM